MSSSYDKSISSKFFLKLACDFLCIPDKNLITPDKWKEDLQNSGFTVKQFRDVSHITFLPYYKYFFRTFVKNKGWPLIIADIAYYLAETNQLFSYVIAVCKKQ